MFALTLKNLTKPAVVALFTAATLVPTTAFARVHDAGYDRRANEHHERDSREDRGHWQDDRRESYRNRDHDNWSVDINVNLGRPAPLPAPRRVERVWVEPVYRTECQQVWIEPEYRTVCDRIWVEPVTQQVCERVWVAPVYDVRDVVTYSHGRRHVEHQRVLVVPGHEEERTVTKVIVEGHYDNVERRELIRDGYWSTVERQVLVSPGHFEDRVCN